jgi:membrane protein YqaA with SNARE-associated domain
MRKPTKREAIIGGISLVVTVALSLFLIYHRTYIEQIAQWGYIGLFIISVISNGTFMIFPGFAIVLTFTLGGVLHPAIVGAVAGIGEAIGAIGAYYTGYAGRGLLRDRNSAFYRRFSNIVDRHGSKAIFFVSAILSPISYPFAIFLGMLRFGFVSFFLATWAGRTVKGMALAYLGYFGLGSILRWLGVGV